MWLASRLGILVAVLAGGCATEPRATASAAVASLSTAPVEAATYLPVATLDGSVDPVASVQLGFDVPGRIERLLVQRGDSVAKGDAVATLDDRMARAQLAQAEAATAGAEAQLAAGEAAFARARALHEAGGLSEQQWKDAEAGVLAGRAGVDQARAAVALARTHVANHTLRAPIAGTITNCPDNAGMMIGAGTPLFLLEDLSALQIKGAVGENDGWVAAGMAASVVPGADSRLSAVATVSRVIPALDPMTRRLPVELRLDNPPPGLRAHAYARATITATEPVPAFAVPRAAVVARPDFSVVVQRGEVHARVPVKVLAEEAERTLVRGELQPGDLVVLYPPSGLGGEG